MAGSSPAADYFVRLVFMAMVVEAHKGTATVAGGAAIYGWVSGAAWRNN